MDHTWRLRDGKNTKNSPREARKLALPVYLQTLALPPPSANVIKRAPAFLACTPLGWEAALLAQPWKAES